MSEIGCLTSHGMIFQLYMCRPIEKEVEPMIGLQSPLLFRSVLWRVRPSTDQGPTFYGYSEKAPHFSRILRRAWGYGGPIVVVHPRVPREELQAMCERIVEQGPSPSLLNLVLFCFECFVCFVLCPCLKPKFQTKLVRLCI